MYPSEAAPKPEATAGRPRRRSRAEKQQETRRRLLDAAAEVFIRRGFQGASIEEITAEAGFTRGAFYSNFESKEEMFVELLQDRVYRRYGDIITKQPPGLSPREAVRWVANELVKIYGEEGETWLFALWFEFLAHAARHPEFRSLAATFWSGSRSVGAAQIEAGYAARGAKPPLDPKDLATASIALDIGLAVQNMVDPDDVPLDAYPPIYDLLFGRLFDEAGK
jgi:AcrR family transcriptional regulator